MKGQFIFLSTHNGNEIIKMYTYNPPSEYFGDLEDPPWTDLDFENSPTTKGYGTQMHPLRIWFRFPVMPTISEEVKFCNKKKIVTEQSDENSWRRCGRGAWWAGSVREQRHLHYSRTRCVYLGSCSMTPSLIFK